MTKIKWGILGTATIAVEAVIPAMLRSDYCEVSAIASRDIKKAEEVARSFHIRKWYGNYDELLGDPQIQAIYIPLPNHLHVQWAIKAIRAGKHVLVEKPIALDRKEAQKLLNEAEKHPELKVMEAFMYKFHPQWIKTRQMVREGAIGELKMIQSSFSFFDADPGSIVNKKEFGGGSLMDVGCYPVSISRFLFNAEPKQVISIMEYDPKFGVDIHATGTMEFEEGRSIFFSSIQLFENQQVKLFGAEGTIEFEIPFNPRPDKPAKIWWIRENLKKEIDFEPCDQYTLQTDIFSRAILENQELPVSLKDSVNNMIVLDAIKESARLGKSIPLRFD